MGDLLLCSSPLAAVPYYIEGISINIYSLEELCYYISQNTFLLDKEFISAELIRWIRDEIGMDDLAGRLTDILNKNGRLSDFTNELFKKCGYCSEEEMLQILSVIRDMEGKTDFERNKLRADRLMDNEKYLSCIYEYKRLLDMKDSQGQTPELLGDIWHNLGIAYARMFLFDEAVNCFERAYSLNQNPESSKARLFCYKCMEREIDYMKVAKEYGLDDEERTALDNEFAAGNQQIEVEKLRQQLEDIRAGGSDWQEYRSLVQTLIFQWKEQYRKISKM